MKKQKTNWLLGGFQAHQNWRNDGYCTSLTAAMGMGGGYTPVVLEFYDEENISKRDTRNKRKIFPSSI